jgi:hypothetical protein
MVAKSVVKACIAALLLGGCGGSVVEGVVPETTATVEQALLWACTGTDTWTRYWYSDYQRTQEKGREDCNCDGTITRYGQTGGYYSQVGGSSCSGGGGGGGGGGGCLAPSPAPSTGPSASNYPPPPEC